MQRTATPFLGAYAVRMTPPTCVCIEQHFSVSNSTTAAWPIPSIAVHHASTTSRPGGSLGRTRTRNYPRPPHLNEITPPSGQPCAALPTRRKKYGPTKGLRAVSCPTASTFPLPPCGAVFCLYCGGGDVEDRSRRHARRDRDCSSSSVDFENCSRRSARVQVFGAVTMNHCCSTVQLRRSEKWRKKVINGNR